MNSMMSMMTNLMTISLMGGMVSPVMAQAGRETSSTEGIFNEVARVRLTSATDLTISEVTKYGMLTGYSLCKYVRTQRYTGYGRGVFIPIDKVGEFLTTFSNLAPRR